MSVTSLHHSRPPRRSRSFAVSVTLHAVAVVLVLAIAERPSIWKKDYRSSVLIAPAPQPKSEPVIQRLKPPPKQFAPPVIQAASLPKVTEPVLLPPVAQPVDTPRVLSQPLRLPVVPPPSPPRETGQFASAHPVVPDNNPKLNVTESGGFANVSLRNVAPLGNSGPQTGGFGDASAARGSPQPGAGRISESGFGAVRAPARQAASSAPVARNGFGDVTAAAPVLAIKEADANPSTPVAILAKPRPAYTPEGRSLHIEGEVAIEVLFAASGEVRILRIVRGLGHGLDENAVTAARGIRFRPAERAGRPVDTKGTVHITFELAY